MIRGWGRQGLLFLQNLGRSGLFLLHVLLRFPHLKRSVHYIMEQVFATGVLSLIIIIVSSLFIGMVVGLQGYHTLSKFGAQQELGQLLALSIVRELGPVVTALLFAGRAGSALTAEIGLMKATDQLASMEMMGVDPLRRIIAPRLWGGLLALPLLTIIFNMMAILGGYFVGVDGLGVDRGAFWNNMQSAVDFHGDILNSMLKSVVFGLFVTWIAIYQGYAAKPTSVGIADATTKCVVYASLIVLGLDFILTAIMLGGW